MQLRINLVANSPSFCWGQAPTRSSTFCVQISKESFDGSNVGTKDQRWLLIAVSFPKVPGGYQSSPLIAPLPIWLAERFQSSITNSSKMSSRGSSTFSPSTRSIESGSNHRQQKGDHTQTTELPELDCQAKAKPTNDPPQALLSQTPSNEGCDTCGLCPSLPATLVEITIYIYIYTYIYTWMFQVPGTYIIINLEEQVLHCWLPLLQNNGWGAVGMV